MVLKKIGGKNFIINLLADFIVQKLGKENSSKIVVLDVENFFIVKGKTSSKDILNLSEVMTEFQEKYSDYLNEIEIFKTIDLIQYDIKLFDTEVITHCFFNTENCSYQSNQIELYKKSNDSVEYDSIPLRISEEELCYVSEFPHGYSLDQGRLLYYFMKKIFYSLPSNYPIVSLTMRIDKNKEEFIEVFDNFSQSNDSVIESAILDSVSLNLEKLEKVVTGLEFDRELLNPLEEHSFLLEEKLDIMII